MATTAYNLTRGAWLPLGTSPCTVYNPGPGDIRLAVDSTLPGSVSAPGIPLPQGKSADCGIVGQNVYAIAVDVGGSLPTITLTVTR